MFKEVYCFGAALRAFPEFIIFIANIESTAAALIIFIALTFPISVFIANTFLKVSIMKV